MYGWSITSAHLLLDSSQLITFTLEKIINPSPSRAHLRISTIWPVWRGKKYLKVSASVVLVIIYRISGAYLLCCHDMIPLII